MKLKNSAFHAFFEQNPDADILHASLFRRETLDALKWDGLNRDEMLGELRTYQRLMRLWPDEDTADQLRSKGLHSAHHIAAMTEDRFAAEWAPSMSGGEESARLVHRRAVDIKSRAALMWANVRDLTASPHYRATRFANADSGLVEFYQSVPSYEDMFGSMDYCSCEHCRSILSPAAYFVDLMRLAQEYITVPNEGTIPPGLTLQDRRPDLFTIPLDCSNTNITVSFLEIVNSVMLAKLEVDLGQDVLLTMANAPYPFNLPYQHPLEQIRIYVEHFKTTLAQIYQVYDVDAFQVARESLQLSLEQYAMVTTPTPNATALSADYGMTITDTDLGGLDQTSVFTARTGMTLPGFISLLQQNLSEAEIATKSIPHSFFINSVLPADTYLYTIVNNTDPNNPYEQIINLNLQTLDTLNRFIRFARKIAWTYADVDWAMKSVGATAINQSAIENLAAIEQLRTRLNIPVDVLCSFWSDMKTIGAGNGPAAEDLFDRVYNNALLLGNEPPYHPQYAGNPLYKDAVVNWIPAQTASQSPGSDSNAALRSRLTASLTVSDNDLTLLASQVISILGITDGIIPLTVPNLSIFYRLSRCASALGLSVDAYLTLLGLMGKKQTGSIADVAEVAAADTWMDEAGIDVYELQYAITGVHNKYVKPGYTAIELRSFMEGLWISSTEWTVQPGSFANADIDATASGQIYRQLAAQQFIDARGIVLDKDTTFSELARLIKSVADSFVTADITPAESASTYTELISHQVLDADGYLSFTFNDKTDLSFLFVGDSNKAGKTEEVRNILLHTRDLQELIAVRPDSFLNDIISEEESAEAFTQLVEHAIINDVGVLSDTFNDKTDLSFLLPGSTNRETKIAYIQGVLLQVRRNILYVGASLSQLLLLQTQGLTGSLATFFATDMVMMTALMNFASVKTGTTDVLALFLSPHPAEEPLPQSIYDYMDALSYVLFVARLLTLTAADVQSILDNPASYSMAPVAQGFHFSMSDLMTLYKFRKLVAEFDNADTELIAYFAMPNDSDCATGAKSAALAAISGWSREQICALSQVFWPDEAADTVADVAWLNAAFNMAELLGVDVYFMLRLSSLNNMPATSGDNWELYNAQSRIMLDAVNARYSDAEWVEVYDGLSGALNANLRDALMGYLIWHLNATYPEIQTPQDLYQFLLIDVEMSGCARISPIKQGIGSVQLYLQRSRMDLEPGVVIPPTFQEVWWDWMANYRIWEANRKVYLYPEMYLNPVLRHNKTPLFRELEDELLQSDINDETVTQAYLNYFDKFAELAKLDIVGSYYQTVVDPEFGEVDSLYLFGRTPTEPNIYYYRTVIIDKSTKNVLRWAPWEEIKISIKSPYVTPVYVFDRLYLFWVETEEITNSTFTNGSSSDQVTHKASIQYSFYNFSKEWIQPQVLVDDIITYFYPDPYISKLTPYVNSMNLNLATDNVFWNKVYAIPLYVGDADKEQLMIIFGDEPNLPPSSTAPPEQPPVTGNSDLDTFNNMFYTSISRAVDATDNGLRGYTSVVPGITLSNRLVADRTYLILQNYNTISGAPRPYRSTLDVDNAKLNVQQTSNALYDNYMGDVEARLWLITPENPTTTPLGLLSNISQQNAGLQMVKNMPGWFVFDNGDESFLVQSQESGIKQLTSILFINYDLSSTDETDLLAGKYTDTPQTFGSFPFRFIRLTTNTIVQLSRTLLTQGIDGLLTLRSQETPELPFSRFEPSSVVVPPASEKLDFSGAFGQYFWEVFFYIPFLIADRLNSNQRFEEAQRWYQFIFNPTVRTDEASNSTDRYWQFLPLRNVTVESMEEILTDPVQIAVYNNDPFDPDALAHLRPSAFQKAVVMKYIDNLIDWGDQLFSRDTWETIIEATMLYVLAQDLLGQKPKMVDVCEQEPTSDFQDILDKYGDNIPQFLIDLENTLPVPKDSLLLQNKPYNDVEGYFCVGENEGFAEYWDRIADRLFKIRHCMNIDGVERQLPLFEPPIDPNRLVAATASGTDIAKVAAYIEPPVPGYRFAVVLDRAKAVTASLMQLGASLLGALERKDNEDFTLLNITQEKSILTMTQKVKDLQVQEAIATTASLQESRNSAQMRYQFYTNLISVGLLPTEILNIQSMIIGNVLNMAGGIMKLAASVSYLIPNAGSPFAMTYGGRQIGSSLDAVGSYFDLLANFQNFIGSLSLTMAGYQRREQDWKLQQSLADFDVKQIDYQIVAARIREDIAKRDYEINQRSIDNATQTEEFLRNKFTNRDLYQWMANRLSTVYFQTYKLALNLALSAQKAYQYERDSEEVFIDMSYWDSLKKGLLAGEGLMLSLQQMEDAYSSGNARRLEIRKTISLLQVNPKAVLDLRNSGVCYFEFDEKLFDMDYPGHYARKIKSLSVVLPSVVGPYQNIHATLTQIGNRVIMKPNLNAVNFLLGGEGATEPQVNILRTNWRTQQQIALSTGVDDSGMFELNFSDERYLPFEGTGAVSLWELRMPKENNRIDFDSITDVIIQLNYTARAGDTAFRSAVAQLPPLQEYSGYTTLTLAQEFSTAWYAFMHPQPTAIEQVLSFAVRPAMFPAGLSSFEGADIYLQIETAPGVAVSGTLKLTVNIIDKPVPMTFTDTNAASEPVPAGASLFGAWSIVVKKDDIPASLQGADKFLDPAKVLNMWLIITYDAAPDQASSTVRVKVLPNSWGIVRR